MNMNQNIVFVRNNDLKHHNKACKDYIYKRVFFMYIKNTYYLDIFLFFKIMQLFKIFIFSIAIK